MERNVGGLDRKIRGVLAGVAGVLGVSFLLSGKKLFAGVSLAASLGFALNYLTCFCTLNKILGVNTAEEPRTTSHETEEIDIEIDEE